MLKQQDFAAKLNKTPTTTKYFLKQARQQDLQILSRVNSYWFAMDNNEKQAFLRLMQKQAFSRLETASQIKSTLKQIQRLMSLEGTFDEVADDEK